jgi:hypothetical protein
MKFTTDIKKYEGNVNFYVMYDTSLGKIKNRIRETVD